MKDSSMINVSYDSLSISKNNGVLILMNDSFSMTNRIYIRMSIAGEERDHST